MSYSSQNSDNTTTEQDALILLWHARVHVTSPEERIGKCYQYQTTQTDREAWKILEACSVLICQEHAKSVQPS